MSDPDLLPLSRLSSLRDYVVVLVNDTNTIHLMAGDVGIETSRLDWSGSAQKVWQVVIEEASRQGYDILEALINRVGQDYGAHARPLREILLSAREARDLLSGLADVHSPLPVTGGKCQPVGGIAANPFYTGGTIPLGHPSYVVRNADRILETSIVGSRYVALIGPPASGKSSLMLRSTRLLGDEWIACTIDCGGVRSEDTRLFAEDFFGFVEDTFPSVTDWNKLVAAIAGQKTVLLLDELSSLTPEVTKHFMHKLRWIGTRLGHSLQVVATFHHPVDAQLRESGLLERQYEEQWTSISIAPLLTRDEALDLFSLFPAELAGWANENHRTICRQARSEARRLQRLCYRLYDFYVLGKLSLADFNKLILSRSSYE